jgi:hypothetical protein
MDEQRQPDKDCDAVCVAYFYPYSNAYCDRHVYKPAYGHIYKNADIYKDAQPERYGFSVTCKYQYKFDDSYFHQDEYVITHDNRYVDPGFWHSDKYPDAYGFADLNKDDERVSDFNSGLIKYFNADKYHRAFAQQYSGIHKHDDRDGRIYKH